MPSRQTMEFFQHRDISCRNEGTKLAKNLRFLLEKKWTSARGGGGNCKGDHCLWGGNLFG